MEHVVIMKRSSDYLERIISGEKVVESRWYVSRISPWDRIKKGDVVYFKNSGCGVSVEARVGKIIQYENLTLDIVEEIVLKFGERIGISDFELFIESVKGKRYCILVFLEDVCEIEPFEIDKTGFGMMSAWICVEDVDEIKI